MARASARDPADSRRPPHDGRVEIKDGKNMAKSSKMKSHKGLRKRVKVTGAGRILRRKANKGHLMTCKTAKRRRRLGRPALIAHSELKRITRMLAY